MSPIMQIKTRARGRKPPKMPFKVNRDIRDAIRDGDLQDTRRSVGGFPPKKNTTRKPQGKPP